MPTCKRCIEQTGKDVWKGLGKIFIINLSKIQNFSQRAVMLLLFVNVNITLTMVQWSSDEGGLTIDPWNIGNIFFPTESKTSLVKRKIWKQKFAFILKRIFIIGKNSLKKSGLGHAWRFVGYWPKNSLVGSSSKSNPNFPIAALQLQLIHNTNHKRTSNTNQQFKIKFFRYNN